ncbi:MAG: COG1361 S-layer family protein [Brevefilum sp.]|jgi:hypothetical protein
MKKKTLVTLLLLIGFLYQLKTPVVAQSAADRPVISIDSYSSLDTPARGEDFEMTIIFFNSGQRAATNLMIEFAPGDLIPRDNGGLQTIYQLIKDEAKGIKQNFTVSPDLWGAQIANVSVSINYSDYDGNVYSDSFNLAVNLHIPPYNAPTPTPAGSVRPQLVIQSFSTDEAILQPGTIFDLNLSITNLGNSTAKSVTKILGGGTVETDLEGTPQPGISGGSGDFTLFAPLVSSNIQFIGDILPGETVEETQRIIVNVNTTPGAHSLNYSFVYLTEDGEKVVDNQVITLLVYRLPSLQVDFSMEPGPFFANQPNLLPLQVVNLGKQTVILGNMQVTASDALLENNIALVGAIESGFYFTLDSMITPYQAGPMEILVSVSFTDDFNQPQSYDTTLLVDVIEMDMGDFGEGDDQFPPFEDFDDWEPVPAEETFWQKLLRVLKGLIGLDSGVKTDPMFYGDEGFPSDLP